MKIYIPFLYSDKIKRPDKRYFLNSIIGEDFIILLLTFTYSSSHPWFNALGLFLLQASFWCIYEVGYIENDLIGEKFEDKAILSYNFKSYEACGFWQPWLWSIVLSIFGIILLSKEKAIETIDIDFLPFKEFSPSFLWISKELIYWIIFLLVLRGIFYIYNHINKQSRVWFYLLLQACRYCGYLVILTTNTVGLILLVSNILTRSTQYTLYRYLGGKNSSWPMDFPRYFFCLLIYLLLLGSIAANDRDLSLIVNSQVLFIAAFCLTRGSKHFYKVFSQFIPVSKDGSNRVM